jgi:hypothetical protein
MWSQRFVEVYFSVLLTEYLLPRLCVYLTFLQAFNSYIPFQNPRSRPNRPFADGLCSTVKFFACIKLCSRSQWPLRLRRGSMPACLLELRVRIPPGAGMSVSCECCVLSGRGLMQRSPTECGVPEYDREALTTRRPWSTWGCCAMRKNKIKLHKGGGGSQFVLFA